MIRQLYMNLYRMYESLINEHELFFQGKTHPSFESYFNHFKKEEFKLLNKLELKIGKYEDIKLENADYDETIHHRNAMKYSLEYLKDDLGIYKEYYKDEEQSDNINTALKNIGLLIDTFEENIK